RRARQQRSAAGHLADPEARVALVLLLVVDDGVDDRHFCRPRRREQLAGRLDLAVEVRAEGQGGIGEGPEVIDHDHRWSLAEADSSPEARPRKNWAISSLGTEYIGPPTSVVTPA